MFCASFSALLLVQLLHPSCANTSASPSGGPKDTLPPLLLSTVPPARSTGFHGKKVELKFNEFVKLTDAAEHVVLSPPLDKKIEVKTKGKGVVVDFPCPLDSATTYTLYFGNAISDNNEGNAFPNYALSFSTGDSVDSLMISGLVVDAYTLLPVGQASVMLHKHLTDTTLEKVLPVSVTRTDDWGYFCLRNVRDTLYHLFVITDENNNFKYDRSNEVLAYHDSLIRPVKVMREKAPELAVLNPKDTVALLKRPIEYTLYTFKENMQRQSLLSKERTQPRLLSFKFNAPDARIDSLRIEGVDTASYIIQYNYQRDSILYWLNQKKMPDTLKCILNYYKTDDSLNILVPAADTFKFGPVDMKGKALVKKMEKSQEVKKKEGPVLPTIQRHGAARRAGGRQPDGQSQDNASGPPAATKRSDLIDMNIASVPEEVEQKGFIFTFKSFPTRLDYEKIRLSHVNTKEDTLSDAFTFERDLFDSLVFCLKAKRWENAAAYTLVVPEKTFTDVNGFTNDSICERVTLPSQDKASLIKLNITGCSTAYIVDLMNAERNKIHVSHWIQSDTLLVFPYLKAGKYAIRFIEDRNRNRIWDTGDFLKHRQAERVRMYTLPGKKQEIELKENIELQQSVDIRSVFNQDVTLTLPSKHANKR